MGGNILAALFLLFFAKCISYKDEIYRVVKIFILVQVYSSLFLKDCTRCRLSKFLIAPLFYKKILLVAVFSVTNLVKVTDSPMYISAVKYFIPC